MMPETGEFTAEERILRWCRSIPLAMGFPAMRETVAGECIIIDVGGRSELDPNGTYDWQRRAKRYAEGKTWDEVLAKLRVSYNDI